MIPQSVGQRQNQIQSSNKISPGRIEGYDKQRKDDDNKPEIRALNPIPIVWCSHTHRSQNKSNDDDTSDHC